jgi:hypothetical protein
MADLPNNKTASVEDVKRLVAGAFNSVHAVDATRSDARESANSASQAATGEREHLLVTLSDAALTQQWDGILLEQGVDAAKAARNNQKDTSINTFASEIKRACHPSVRAHVSEFFTLADAAWEADGETDDKPLRKAFARKYHMVVGAMFNAAIAGDAPTNETTLRDMAQSVIRERERDYTKTHGRLQAIRKQLLDFAKDFPVDGITACVEFLGEITKDELKACVQPKAAPTEAPAPASEPEALEGVVDTDDLLAGVNADLAAPELKAA